MLWLRMTILQSLKKCTDKYYQARTIREIVLIRRSVNAIETNANETLNKKASCRLVRKVQLC